MEPRDKAPVESQSHSSVQSNVRAKSDKAWDHATLHIEDGKKVYICNYCSKVGGGINRVKNILPVKRASLESASQWIESGCTIMSDGWTDIRQRHLINFLVYCPKGISFIKSVDASDIENNATNLCNLFTEIVEMVGAKNVVQMVTDNAANYKAAGKMLTTRYRYMVWSPCAAHCLNLILKDVSELDNVKHIITLASRVTVFIYNHKWPLSWLRKRHGWTEIIRPATTRFGVHLNMIEKYFPGDECIEVTKLLGIYRDGEGEFSRISTVKGRSQHRPDEWWRLFAGKYPKIQEFAIKILGWIHKRDSNDICICSNTQLAVKNRLKVDKRSYDPIDYECIDDTDFWVVEEQPQRELDYDQLETMLDDQDEEPPS
ncbi:hypothetical protein Tco_1011843 [Tanacetum coccineum]